MFSCGPANPCGVTNETAAASNTTGIQLRAAGKLPEAIAAFRRGIAAHPDVIALRQNLAQTLFESGDIQGAIAEHRAILRIDHQNVGSNLTLYELLQMSGERVLALAHQRLALEVQRLYSEVAPHQVRSVLVLCAPGDWQANIPIDFVIDRDTTTVHKLYLLDAARVRQQRLPSYDVVWNAIAESPEARPYLDLAAQIMAEVKVPTLNAPSRVLETERLRLPQTLAKTGAHVPPVERVAPQALQGGQVPFAFPIIARPFGSHAGHGLERLTNAAECAGYVAREPHDAYVVSPFIEYASADGFYRKYRVVFVDGVPYPTHLAISPNWMIHYYNAPMRENAWMRDEEAAFLKDVRVAFDGERYDALLAIAGAVGLEYFGIDCAIERDGKILVFEADPAMLVHTTDPADVYPYKLEFVPRIYRAIEAMIDRRKS